MKVPSCRRLTVSERNLKIWKTRYGQLPKCQLCDLTLVVGDDVLVKSTQRGRKPYGRYFHYRCLEEGSVPRGHVSREPGRGV